jgi:hypothetical protein
MLNPIKTPLQMLYEQAGVPHLSGGGKGDVLMQFSASIQKAIRDYTRATGKAPTPQEVKQLEDYVRSLSKPTGGQQQTLARTAAMEPNANKLVDEFGRPYAPMVDPKTGKLTTPERAQGFTVSNQFEVNPQTRKARKGSYEKGYDEVARPDEFVQIANVGRASNRTNQRSTLPSTEELLAMQHNAENAVDDLSGLAAASKAPNETYGLTEGPTSASQIFADTSGAIEHGALLGSKQNDLREQLVMALNPQAGEKVARPLKADIERARQSFLERGIEPDQEDIINAILADRNAAQHNYLGINPTAERPFNDPKAGKVSPEYLAWQEKMRAAGMPERVWGRNPADWDPVHKRNYLLDTAPEDRLPFAADWNLEDLVTNQGKKNVVKKAEGGFIPSPRDMRATLLVNGYAGGGRPSQFDPVEYDPYTATRREDYNMGLPESQMLDTREQGRISAYNPTPRERIAEVGQNFLENIGIRRPIARRASQSVAGGPSSPFATMGTNATNMGLDKIGLVDAAMFSRPGFVAALPLIAGEVGQTIGQGDYAGAMTGALAAGAMGYPGLYAGKKLYNKAKTIPASISRQASKVNPRYAAGLGATGLTGLNAYPDE